jgi:hypothetical protein
MQLSELLSLHLELSGLLQEKRDEFLAKQFGPKLVDQAKKDHAFKGEPTPEEVVNALKKADPTDGKHLQFVIRMFLKGQFKLEDVNRIRGELEKFEKFRSKLQNKDLNSYKTLNDLYDALEQFEEKDALSGKQLAKLKKSDAEKVIDTPGFIAIKPHSEDAAKFYGAGTKWCTAGENDNMFQHYYDQGHIYILIAKINGKDRKFQLHYESGQFMDERDQEVSKKDISELSKLDGYTKFLNLMIKKHYEPAIKALEGEDL